MRMLVHVHFPIEPFNSLIRSGTAGTKIQEILGSLKPEAAYFTEQDGRRGATLVVNINNSSEVPALAEPWFMVFNAEVEFRIAMTPEELGQAGLDALGKKWG